MRKTCAPILLAAMALAGCSSASGPTFDAHSVTQLSHETVYRVRCYGLLEGPKTCESKAREICGSATVRPIEAIAPLTDGGDARELTFACGVPSAQPTPLKAAPVTAPAPVPVVSFPRKTTLDGDANFDFDKATLRPDARGRLDRLIAQAHGIAFSSVTVDGYTDALGSDTYNNDLSSRRAQAVATYLQQHGLNAQRYVTHGYGKTAPVATNASAAGRAQNRRVEIVLESR